MQGQLNAYSKQASVPDKQAFVNLKTSLKEIEKRCVKYQKSEAELKRQVNTYRNPHVPRFLFSRKSSNSFFYFLE